MRNLPVVIRRWVGQIYWVMYDLRDYLTELTGYILSHRVRLFALRRLGVKVGSNTSVHRKCRFYQPSGVSIGSNTVVNRNVLLDGRKGITVGDNVSISEGVRLISLEHDPQHPMFVNRGGHIQIKDYVFIGSEAMILPAVTLGKGCVIGARAVVTKDVQDYTIVAGVPAKPIGKRNSDLQYHLNYHKFLG